MSIRRQIEQIFRIQPKTDKSPDTPHSTGKLKRRQFLKLLGVSAAAVAASQLQRGWTKSDTPVQLRDGFTDLDFDPLEKDAETLRKNSAVTLALMETLRHDPIALSAQSISLSFLGPGNTDQQTVRTTLHLARQPDGVYLVRKGELAAIHGYRGVDKIDSRNDYESLEEISDLAHFLEKLRLPVELFPERYNRLKVDLNFGSELLENMFPLEVDAYKHYLFSSIKSQFEILDLQLGRVIVREECRVANSEHFPSEFAVELPRLEIDLVGRNESPIVEQFRISGPVENEGEYQYFITHFTGGALVNESSISIRAELIDNQLDKNYQLIRKASPSTRGEDPIFPAIIGLTERLLAQREKLRRNFSSYVPKDAVNM